MSLNTKCIDCLEMPHDWLDALKRTILKDSDGNYYVNVHYMECPDECDDVEPALDCVSDMSAEELFLNTIVQDACGNCAISLIGNICDVCGS